MRLRFFLFVLPLLAEARDGPHAVDVDPARPSLPPDFEPVSYNLTFRFEPDMVDFNKFSGIADVTVRALRDTFDLQMDANLTLNYLTVQSDTTMAQLEHVLTQDDQRGRIHIHLPLGVRRGDVLCLHFDYVGTIHDRTTHGVFVTEYTDVASEHGDLVYATHLEPHYAKNVFPCFDEPQYKTPFYLQIAVPGEFEVISNAKKVSTYHNNLDFLGLHTFEETIPLPTYLFAFAFGNIAAVKSADDQTRIWSHVAHKDKLGTALEVAEKCTAALIYYTNMSLPAPMNHLAVGTFPDSMENFGLIVYDRKYIVLDSEDVSDEQMTALRLLVCQKLAHQWFGGLVTSRRWGDLFLNKGLSAYFAFHASQSVWNAVVQIDMHDVFHEIPQKCINEMSAIRCHFFTDTFSSAIKADANATHAVLSDRGYFDAITYDKGAFLLWQLADVIGSGRFMRALRLYLAHFKQQTVTHIDLLRKLQEVLDEDEDADAVRDWCGERLNVTAYFLPWLTRIGHPRLYVQYQSGYEYKVSVVRADSKPQSGPEWAMLFHLTPGRVWFAPLYKCANGTTLPSEMPLRMRFEKWWDFSKHEYDILLNADVHVLTEIGYDGTAWNWIRSTMSGGYYYPKITAFNRLHLDNPGKPNLCRTTNQLMAGPAMPFA